jgi:hypothetical protein
MMVSEGSTNRPGDPPLVMVLMRKEQALELLKFLKRQSFDEGGTAAETLLDALEENVKMLRVVKR